MQCHQTHAHYYTKALGVHLLVLNYIKLTIGALKLVRMFHSRMSDIKIKRRLSYMQWQKSFFQK